MVKLKLTKLYLDVFLGLILTILAVYLAVGQLTIVDQKVSLPIVLACDAVLEESVLLQAIQPSLRGNEQCHLQKPCVRVHTLACERSQSATELVKSIVIMDIFATRVQTAIQENYRLAGFRDDTNFIVPLDTLRLLMGYAIMLLFGCAFLFALWRQRILRQTFGLPDGSRSDQLLMPALYGVIVATLVMVVSYGLSFWVELPNPSDSPMMNSLFTSFTGAVLAVIIGPFMEELVFRGVWLRYFMERGQALKGALAVSAVFAWIHATSLDTLGWKVIAMVLYMAVSLVFCRVYIKQNNLWSAIICHAAYNSTLLITSLLYSLQIN